VAGTSGFFSLLFIWALQGQLSAVKLHAKTGRLPRTLIQSTLESIRFVTRVRLETEQQNGQGANDYYRSHGYGQILLVCQLHCHGPGVGFDNPSFEIRITAASHLAVRTLPAFLKERMIIKSTFTVNHNEHVSNRSFEEVVSAFESAVGSVEDTGFPALLASTKSAEEFEASVQSRAGSSGFMRFLTVDRARDS
jgi:hypothetical protein